VLFGKSGRARAPEQREREPELVGEHLERPPRARFTVDREPPERRPPDQHRVRPPDRPRATATSVPRLMPPSSRTGIRPATALDHLGQRLDRRGRVVELAPAVIRDDHSSGAMLHRERRIVAPDQSLDQDRQFELAAELLEV